MADQLSVRWIKGRFYGNKRTIGGHRTYFSREFGITADSATSFADQVHDRL